VVSDQENVVETQDKKQNLLLDKLDVQGDSSFTARMINPIKNLVKITKLFGLHSLHIKLETYGINFLVLLHSRS
jgi:hypothetical protein